MNNPRYKAFISYSHDDDRSASWIQRALERYRIPGKLVDRHSLASNRLGRIFRDRDELSSSSSLTTVILEALNASENLIVVCSPSAAQSHWVNEEIKAFSALGRRNKIFCMIVDGDMGECFPPALLDDEPLGVDIRSTADGKKNAKLKLVASLLDIPFADIKDREQRRRSRLLASAATAGLLLSGLMTTLAINALLAGREAERSRVVATEALADAEAVAEFLATMLTEIDPEAMGRTIVDGLHSGDEPVALPAGFSSTELARRMLDEHVLKNASAAVNSQFQDRPAIGARLEKSLGASYHAIGLYADAIERYTASEQLYQQTFGKADARTLSARTGLGGSYLYEGRLDDAAATLEATVSLARDALGPSDDATMAAMNALAMTYTDMRRLSEALELLEKLSALMIETKGREDLTTVDVRANLAWTLYLLGDYERAEPIAQEQYELRRNLLGPDNYNTLSLLNNLALIYSKTGRLSEAEEAHREELRLSQRVQGTDHPEVFVSMLNLGRVLMRSDKNDQAFTLLSDALARAERVLPEVHPLTAAIATACGEVMLNQGKRVEALGYLLKTQSIYQQMFEPGHPRFNGLNELLAQARE